MNIANLDKPKLRVVLEVDEATYNQWKRIAEDYEELPEDYNPNDYAGGNMDDAFHNGEEHGWDQAITSVMDNMVKVEEIWFWGVMGSVLCYWRVVASWSMPVKPFISCAIAMAAPY